ncbi:MAG: hypothetical protein RDV48_13375 [Candidatus Eremiobacteraeota bacterium]|nr:hypothetical protein [Candidatus Eremiobacteraeota bacterium]
MSRKGCAFIALGALLSLAVLAAFLYTLITGIGNLTKNALTVNSQGATVMNLVPGEYTFFLERDTRAEADSHDPAVTVTDDAGKALEVKSQKGSKYSLDGRHGQSFARFAVVQAGEYAITIEGPAAEVRIVLLHNFMGGVTRTVLVCVALAGIGGFISIMFLALGISFMMRGRGRGRHLTGGIAPMETTMEGVRDEHAQGDIPLGGDPDDRI